MNLIKSSLPIIIFITGIAILGLALFVFGENKHPTNATSNSIQKKVSVSTFQETNEKEIYRENGKPAIFLFSTTWCPHCQWIKNTFDKTAKEYMEQGKITAYHWELDTNNNTLTDEEEKEIPEEHLKIYKKYNPQGYVPIFIFGNKYIRIGNGHEQEKDLAAEETEFKAVIEKLLLQSNN